MTRAKRRHLRRPATRFQVIGMMGDYHLAHQPFWNVDFVGSDAFEKAVRAADATWAWMIGEDNCGFNLPSNTAYPLGSPETNHAGSDEWHTMCVFVYDPDHDELVEHPRYVRGNPECDEELTNV